MNAKKVYFGLIGLILLLFAGIGASLYLGNNILKNNSQELVELKLENKVIEDQNKALAQAKKDIQEYSELKDISKKIAPQEKDQARTVREIIAIAEQNGISISNISFPNSTLGIAPPKNNSKTEDSNQQTKKAVPPITQVEPVEGLKGVYRLEVSIQSNESVPVSYLNLINFLAALENNRRTAQVSSITITPDKENSSGLSFNITFNVFIKP